MITIVGTSIVAACLVVGLIIFVLSRKTNEQGNAGGFGGEPLPGTVITLAEPLLAGRGRALVAGREWLLDGPDLDAGTTVAVVAARDGKLYVTPHEEGSRLPKAGSFGG